MTLFVIALPGTKVDWDSFIIVGRMHLILLAKTLEMILYKTLHNDMGLKSAIVVGLSTFGIRVIIVSLKAVGNSPVCHHAEHV